MTTEKKDPTGICTGVFTLVTALLRPLPTLFLLPFNLLPVGGLSLFAGARWSSRAAYFVPLAVMVATDLFLWAVKGEIYSPLNFSQPFVYASFMVYVLLGRTLATSHDPLRIGATALLGSLQFFLITNFGAWLANPNLYTRDWSGLLECYVAGLPFYRPTILGDLTFTAVFFLAHAAVARASEPADLERRRIEA
jgi:hypothetical protein